MQRYRRNTITYRGVKVRYSHLFIVENGIEYTTTEIDERNLESIKTAYRKWNVKKGLIRKLNVNFWNMDALKQRIAEVKAMHA